MNIVFAIVIGIVLGTLAGKLYVANRRCNQLRDLAGQAINQSKQAIENQKELQKAYEELATKLDNIKEVEIIDYNYESEELTDELIEDFGCIDHAQNYIECYAKVENELKKAHSDLIRDVVEVLKAEGLINKHLTIELTDKPYVNHCQTIDINGQSYNRIIRVNYRLDSDFNNFIDGYIYKKFNIMMCSNPTTFALFTFLHEFGHYVDSTLEHEENYDEMNQELKRLIPKEVATEEAYEAVQIAYRQIPDEAFADKWAIDFMIKHFPEEFFEEDLSEC
jgi:hypothetical protein